MRCSRTTFGLGFWTCLPLAGILAAFWGVLLGFPVLRLRGDYLAIVTLAFGEIIRIVLINWVSLTNGPNGITGIPRPTLFGLSFSMDGGEGTFAGFFNMEPETIQRVIFLYYVILGLALLTNWFTLRLRRTAAGPRVGGIARGRNRLPLARHQRHEHETDRVRHRRHVRRFRRRLLRHAPGIHFTRELYLH
jgi:ABC-type branched-subunit amino acid transport system permease subunit